MTLQCIWQEERISRRAAAAFSTCRPIQMRGCSVTFKVPYIYWPLAVSELSVLYLLYYVQFKCSRSDCFWSSNSSSSSSSSIIRLRGDVRLFALRKMERIVASKTSLQVALIRVIQHLLFRKSRTYSEKPEASSLYSMLFLRSLLLSYAIAPCVPQLPPCVMQTHYNSQHTIALPVGSSEKTRAPRWS